MSKRNQGALTGFILGLGNGNFFTGFIGLVAGLGFLTWFVWKFFDGLRPIIILGVIGVIGYYAFQYFQKSEKAKKDFEEAKFRDEVRTLFKFKEHEIMESFHKIYFKDDDGSYSQETQNKWRDSIKEIVDKFETTENWPNTGVERNRVYSEIHALALKHERRGAVNFDFRSIDSHDLLVETTLAELELNGWKKVETSSEKDRAFDLKVQKNDQNLLVICVYDIGKIGVGKIRKRLLESRSERANRTTVLSLHGFTSQAEKLCAEAGVFVTTPDSISRLDNRMGI